MNNNPMVYKMTPMRDVYYEEEKRVCCGRLSYKVSDFRKINSIHETSERVSCHWSYGNRVLDLLRDPAPLRYHSPSKSLLVSVSPNTFLYRFRLPDVFFSSFMQFLNPKHFTLETSSIFFSRECRFHWSQPDHAHSSSDHFVLRSRQRSSQVPADSLDFPGKPTVAILTNFAFFQTLTFLWDVVLAIGFFCLSVLPFAYTNDILQYKGSEWNARTFGIVMGSILLLWFVARFFATVVIYRYWKLLRALQGYGNGSDC